MTYFSYWFIGSLVLFMKESRVVWAEDNSKYACRGDSIQLFQNVIIDSIDMVVSLYIKASTNRLIAMWTLQNATISDGYSRKVFFDKYGDLWIRNVSSSDEAQYTLKVGKGSSFVTPMVYLSVLVAPTMNCKPKIKRVEDVLFASLETNECGKPLASVDWLNYLGNFSEFLIETGRDLDVTWKGKVSVMLPRNNNAGTYYACISGPAVRCVRTSKLSDYCSAFAIEDTRASQDISSEPCMECSPSKYSLVMMIVNFLVLFLGLLVFFLCKCKNVTLCYIIKRARDAGKSDYNTISTNTDILETKDVGKSDYTELTTDTDVSDIKVDNKSEIPVSPATEYFSLENISEKQVQKKVGLIPLPPSQPSSHCHTGEKLAVDTNRLHE